MADFKCWVKKRWFISYLLITTIINIICFAVGLSYEIQSMIVGIYFVIHVLFVNFAYNEECDEGEYEDARRKVMRRRRRQRRRKQNRRP